MSDRWYWDASCSLSSPPSYAAASAPTAVAARITDSVGPSWSTGGYWQRCVIAVRAVKNVYSRPVLFVVHISSLLDVYHLCSSVVSAARDFQVGMLNFNSPLSVLISLLIFTVSVFELFYVFTLSTWAPPRSPPSHPPPPSHSLLPRPHLVLPSAGTGCGVLLQLLTLWVFVVSWCNCCR